MWDGSRSIHALSRCPTLPTSPRVHYQGSLKTGLWAWLSLQISSSGKASFYEILASIYKKQLFFISITLRGGSKKILLWFMSMSDFPTFSSKSFIVSGLTFRSLIHLEFIFVYGVREYSNLILLHVAVQFSSTTYWGGWLFSIVCSFLPCRKLGDHMCVGFSLGILSFTIDLYFCFCASTILSWLL